MKVIRIVLGLGLMLICSLAWAQDNNTSSAIEYDNKKYYIISNIDIVGAIHRDENAIKSITGLREGMKIQLPGSKTSKAIKSLWRLRLFEDIRILENGINGDSIDISIVLVERPILTKYSFKGVKKSRHDDLLDIIKPVLRKGGIITEDQKNICIKKVKQFYHEKGYLDAKVVLSEIPDAKKENGVRLLVTVDKKDRVKIRNITFTGNKEISSRKLRKQLSNTKRKWTFFRKSKFVKSDFEEDKKSLIAYYNKKGFKDIIIKNDTVYRDEDGLLRINIDLDEGNRYFFRDIKWKGNSLYDDNQLSTILGISKGDIYNPELLEKRLKFSLDGRDISSLYLDDGYLFFTVNPVEVTVENDSIDIEMRIYEGAQAIIDKVTISGNDRTHEHVIRRSLRTMPGEKFSRSKIIRSQREIINLGYFNQENLEIKTPVNQQRKTVDIEYVVEERPSDQLELSAGYGGFSGLIGTLGLTFNNFSIRNINNRSAWNPLPQGDGQKLSLRAQSNSRFFKSYNFSFTEPWLGGKRPNSFTIGGVHSSYNYATLGRGALTITRGYVGLGTQLKWPDDFFGSSTTLSLEKISLNDYGSSGFYIPYNDTRITLNDGNFKNFSISQVFYRSSVVDPIYPRTGSKISLAVKLTFPYSLFRKDNFWDISSAEEQALIDTENKKRGNRNKMTETEEGQFIAQHEGAKKFEYLEYHKWNFDAEWYFNIFDKLVIATKFKIGMIGYYNEDIGVSPFERFELGGDGLSNQNVGITGKDIISLRGYDVSHLSANLNGGATLFEKFTVELRYPLSLNPSSSIYLMTFLQAGNSWQEFSEFAPFELKRSAGFGLRVFLPMFGLLGFDYGYGFDKNLGSDAKISDYAKFSVILGFEPE